MKGFQYQQKYIKNIYPFIIFNKNYLALTTDFPISLTETESFCVFGFFVSGENNLVLVHSHTYLWKIRSLKNFEHI